MYTGKIGNLEFILEKDVNTRICVYNKGSVDPIAYINVSSDITEKGFHYEIMDYASKHGN
tara:strand:- start:105 stop:284 length:180 start_codon:yes stop_codon:yes gene_type:complete